MDCLGCLECDTLQDRQLTVPNGLLYGHIGRLYPCV